MNPTSPQTSPKCLLIIDFHQIQTPTRHDRETLGSNLPNVFLAQDGGAPSCSDFASFRTDETVRYEGYCDDFGPMNMASIIRFVQALDEQIKTCVKQEVLQLVYEAGEGRRALTNAAFLLGAYMTLRLDQSPDDVDQCFQQLSPHHLEGYRDATFAPPDFRLRLIDCWQGLHRGKAIGWVRAPAASCSADWGRIDRDMYAHYDNPLNADLHEVVPQKFVAFRGPKDLGGPSYRDNLRTRSRQFDPKYYLDIFEDLKVTTVIRLNEAAYSGQVFEDKGINHHDLYFDDCTSPPPAVVKSFIQIVSKAKGAVAIHCKAGLGRTGTLIALCMMREHGFSAREAMGWLRIMRPGSVIGEQQHFLCKVDARLCSLAAAGRLPTSPVAADSWSRRASLPLMSDDHIRTAAPEQAALLAEQVSSGMGRRDEARSTWAGLMHSASLPDLTSPRSR